jgi:hypothetical protein
MIAKDFAQSFLNFEACCMRWEPNQLKHWSCRVLKHRRYYSFCIKKSVLPKTGGRLGYTRNANAPLYSPGETAARWVAGDMPHRLPTSAVLSAV